MVQSTLLSSKLETARTFVPGWWVHAFESSIVSAGVSANIEVCDRGVLPRFSSAELSYLALLLGDIQRQILESENYIGFVELDWFSAQKHLSGTDNQARQRLASVFESLSQIRFPVKSECQELHMIPLFIEEVWLPAESSSGPIRLRLKPSPWALELLTGYTDGHLDFLRRIDSKSPIVSVQRSQSPLVLWTPVWLELSASEQIAYVRMESAMQCEGAWLRLDGLVGCSLEKLTSGVKMTRRHSDEQASPLMERLRLVGKLGRRLVAHGLIQREPNSGYMAIDDGRQSESPVLLWQASAERLKSRAESEYFGLAASRILKISVGSNITDLLVVFATISGAASSVLPILTQIWTEISKIPGVGSIFSSGIMVQAHLLFLEWIARAQTSSLLPLPEVLRKHSAARLCFSIDTHNSGQKFKDFVSACVNSDDLRQIAMANPMFSVFLADLSPSLTSICRESLLRVRKSFLVSHTSDANSVVKPSSPVSKEPLSSIISLQPQSSNESKFDSHSQNLRRIAQEELDKMIRQSPGAYADLKSKYMASLDDDTKSLFLDVQRRLGSKTFDRHLKMRLVHYMVEHPASWNSVSSRLPL